MRPPDQPPTPQMRFLPDLDMQRGPGSRIPRPSRPTSSAGPAPAPAAWSRVWGTWSAVAIDTEEPSGGVRETEAANAGPRTSAASSRIHDGVARAAVRQPACSAAVQQLQLPRSEQLPDLGHCSAPRRARAHSAGQGHRSQWLQEKHAACGPESVSELGQGWARRAPASRDFLLLVHSIPCNLGPPLPPLQCGYHVAFHCPPVAAPKSCFHSSGEQGGGAGHAHFGRGRWSWRKGLCTSERSLSIGQASYLGWDLCLGKVFDSVLMP